jgi:hypothetical protein
LHFAAARNLLSILISKPVTTTQDPYSSTTTTNYDLLTLALTKPPLMSRALSRSETTAVSFFLMSYIWIDVLCQASGLYPPLNPDGEEVDYAAFLEPQPSLLNPSILRPPLVDLQNFMGCANWAMFALLRISSLAAWKAAAQKSNTLSIFELGQRAATIQQDINSRIALLLDERTQRTPPQPNVQSDSSLVTELFARAAIIYLHVVVSGPKPRVPEIRQSVVDTMEVLQALPSRLLIRVSWPFAVTGCMAVGGEQKACREIVERCFAEKENPGTAWKGLRIMETCWGRVERDENGFGWVEAMEVLGQRILLC